MFLHIYDPLNIPHLTVIFVFTPMTFLLQFINILHLVDIFVLSHLWKHMFSLLGRHISFFLIYTSNFWNYKHMCISTQNTNAYEVLSDSYKYFHFSAIFVLSDPWSLMYSLSKWHKARNCILYASMYVSVYVHIHIFTCIHSHVVLLHPSIYAYVGSCLPISIHTYRFTCVCLHTCIYI